MPAFSAHYYFACDLAEKLKKEADFELSRNALLIGAQGPDIFFFHRALPWQRGKTLRKAGSALHRAKCGDILDCFSHYCEKNGGNIAKSYIYGFILHYALDRICHPYIYFIQDRITDKFPEMNEHSAHNIIELSLDSVLISERERTKDPLGFDTAKTADCSEEELRAVSEVIAAAARLVSAGSYTAADAAQAIRDTRGIQRLLTDKSGKKKLFLRSAERLFFPFTGNFMISAFMRTDDLEKAEKYVNINHKGWKSPFGGGLRNESFTELFELAKADALEMIRRFNAGQSGAEITGNISFLTGVKVQ